MKLSALLDSLSSEERDFISELDYGNDKEKHRATLDLVINNGGIIDFNTMGYWFPYEVIELGRNFLQPGHDREYAACLGIVMKNIQSGSDISNDIEYIVDSQAYSISEISPDLKLLITELACDLISQKCQQDDGANDPQRGCFKGGQA